MKKREKKLLEMLTYKRKEGSVGQALFNKRFIQPLMGKPDITGNYLCEVTTQGRVLAVTNDYQTLSNIAFMAHHDTVHRTDGRQKVVYDPTLEHAYTVGNECLGADCTTGVWIILEMIKAKVPGVYIIHTGEECGGIGSSAIVSSKPDWLKGIDYAISFDRYGTDSIITHQMGSRTCSESFSNDLGKLLNIGLVSDNTGVYTDSYEYADDVSECTNISVGYYNQHSNKEYQDVAFASTLLDALIIADWTKLKPYRDPSVVDYLYGGWSSTGKRSTYKSNYGFDDYYSRPTDDWSRYACEDDVDNLCQKYSMEKMVEQFPYEVAEILAEHGYDKRELAKEIIRIHNVF